MSRPEVDTHAGMNRGRTLAYLGGLIDGDGYFKITKNFRTPRIRHPYYANVVGVSQLWPGPAVQRFANTFGGEVKLTQTPQGTRMARCELRGSTATSTARRLVPFLLVKRCQALLFLEAVRLRPRRRGRTLATERGHEQVERVAQALIAVQRGEWDPNVSLPLPDDLRSYTDVTPAQLGWTREELSAYLAGVMDSDGNLRIYRKKVPGMRWPHYRINVRCAQVSPSPAVQLLKETFGGHLAIRKEGRPNHRDLIEWSIDDRGAVPAIKALIPHLRVKWIDACLLMQLRELKSRPKEDLTSWVHANRWRPQVEMRKRSFSARQIEEFERIHQTLLAVHSAGSKGLPSAPATQG